MKRAKEARREKSHMILKTVNRDILIKRLGAGWATSVRNLLLEK